MKKAANDIKRCVACGVCALQCPREAIDIYKGCHAVVDVMKCAGMGNMEATCGALIGAGMVAGLKTEGKGTLGITRQIQEEFATRCGALKCKDLKAMTDGKPLCPCDDCVRNAVMIYGEIMGL